MRFKIEGCSSQKLSATVVIERPHVSASPLESGFLEKLYAIDSQAQEVVSNSAELRKAPEDISIKKNLRFGRR